ncbi:MAG: glycine cleavage T protein (aminomethyl transferase), partial [Desulfobacteraceae bacterium]|nr:glycine cleavage T protein (aminomethyl transferase) [Desulfobacteraceae bacterium]
MPRLTRLPTLRIDPAEAFSFAYRGKTYGGLKGDTVATALYANGIRIFSRSIKYHRPRGLYSLDGESSNCLMDIDGVPNVHAELTPIRDGMNVRPQNVVGSPEIDLKGFMDKLDWAMPAGFYYRYFHKPYRLWPFFLRQIRKAAGIGVIDPSSRMEGRFDEQYLNGEVCVIGGGPAGMMAALV